MKFQDGLGVVFLGPPALTDPFVPADTEFDAYDELLDSEDVQAFQDGNDGAIQDRLDEANKDSSDALERLILAIALLSLFRRPTTQTVFLIPEQRFYQGRFAISESRIRQIVQAEQRRNSRRTTRHARDLTAGRISLREYQRRMTRDVTNGVLGLGQAGAGGRSRFTGRHYRNVYDLLNGDGPGRGELERLQRHVERIANGELSEGQILDRSRRYGNNIDSAYEEARHLSYTSDIRRWEARRFLDPAANHCPDCPGYEEPLWVPAESVVPRAVACRCRGNCRCRVEYRLAPNPGRSPLSRGQLLAGQLQ